MNKADINFFEYWDALGFFDDLNIRLPGKFFIIYEIARVIFSPSAKSHAFKALKTLLAPDDIILNKEESISLKGIMKSAPVSDNMEIGRYRVMEDLKKALPCELAMEEEIFDIRLLKKELLVRRYYESRSDKFQPIDISHNDSSASKNFEQKIFILLDRSKSMDMLSRSYYSKCIIAEYLKEKSGSNAVIYYRPFHSRPGRLFKILDRRDFPRLIERILSTRTGGSGTNLHKALLQAVDDIKFDREMARAEILVVTDAKSKIDKAELRAKLGDIKLNILKIGTEEASPPYYELKGILDRFGIKFNLKKVTIDEIRAELKGLNIDEDNLPRREKLAYKKLLQYSDSLTKDLKDLSEKFIEIPDLEPMDFFKVDKDRIRALEGLISELENKDLNSMQLDELTKHYRLALHLEEFLKHLLKAGNKKNKGLVHLTNKLKDINLRMMEFAGVRNAVLAAGLTGHGSINLYLFIKKLLRKIMEILRSPLTGRTS